MLLSLFAYIEFALLNQAQHSIAQLICLMMIHGLCKVSVKLDVRANEKRMHATGLYVKCLTSCR